MIAAVVDPLPHDGVVRVQVDGDVFAFGVQHVAEFLQAAVLRAAAGRVPQVIHDVRHVHFTWDGKPAQLQVRILRKYLG